MTPNRRYALRWFADHDKDTALVLLKKPPSTRMHRLMRKEGDLSDTWHLTDQGRAKYRSLKPISPGTKGTRLLRHERPQSEIRNS